MKITKLIENNLNSIDRSHSAHPHLLQVCVALQFFALAEFKIFCGNGVHVNHLLACMYIRSVALGLQSVYSAFISMPSFAEKATSKSQFYELVTFLAFLDLGMGHIRIQKPYEDEADYVNKYFTQYP